MKKSPVSATGYSRSFNRGNHETGNNGRHQKLPDRKHGEDSGRKDRSRTGKVDVQLRTANLQHNKTGNAVRNAKASGQATKNGASVTGGRSQPDETLARRIAEATAQVIEEYKKEQAGARRRNTRPYAERLAAFAQENASYDKLLIGRRSWYRNLGVYLTFRECDLERWFRSKEDSPCIMRGSLYALSLKGQCYYNGRKSYWAEKVLDRQVKRWLRKSMITCLSRSEWEGMVYQGFWRKRITRLCERYGCGRWNGMEHISAMVHEFWDRSGAQILLNGERMMVDRKQLEAIREMHQMERRLRAA